MANSTTAHHRRLRLLSFLNDVLPGREDEESLNSVTGGLLIGLEMLLKRSRREKLLLVTHLSKSVLLLCHRLISQNTLCLTEELEAAMGIVPHENSILHQVHKAADKSIQKLVEPVPLLYHVILPGVSFISDNNAFADFLTLSLLSPGNLLIHMSVVIL